MVNTNHLKINKSFGLGRAGYVVLAALATAVLSLSIFVSAFAVQDAVTPSTNEINKASGWAHVNATPTTTGVDLEFVSTRGFVSCFEYRTDGDTSEQTSSSNFNPAVSDGLYPYTCVNNQTKSLTLAADEYVEVRMVFGAEADERFDWTRFDVLEPAVPTSKDDCKKGGYEAFGFKNQGLCVASVQSSDRSKHNR